VIVPTRRLLMMVVDWHGGGGAGRWQMSVDVHWPLAPQVRRPFVLAGDRA
jgi:hypothetical protein